MTPPISAQWRVSSPVSVVLFWILRIQAGYDIAMWRSVMNRIILLLSLALASFTAHAAGYHVELVVFENLQPSPDGEITQITRTYPDYSGAIELGDEAGDQFRLLSSGLYKLGGVYNQLKSSGRFRPFLHLAWQQPALQGNSARPVHVLKAEPGATVSPEDMLIKIDGIVRVRAAQFLHADVDMLFFPTAVLRSGIQSAAIAEFPVLVSSGYSRIRESRRMRLNELHYFDHPLFGIIMHISRAE